MTEDVKSDYELAANLAFPNGRIERLFDTAKDAVDYMLGIYPLEYLLNKNRFPPVLTIDLPETIQFNQTIRFKDKTIQFAEVFLPFEKIYDSQLKELIVNFFDDSLKVHKFTLPYDDTDVTHDHAVRSDNVSDYSDYDYDDRALFEDDFPSSDNEDIDNNHSTPASVVTSTSSQFSYPRLSTSPAPSTHREAAQPTVQQQRKRRCTII